MELFLGHPSRMLHDEFWDGANFSLGRNPPRDQWKRPRRKTDRDVDLVLEHLGQSIDAILALPGIQPRTIGEMNRMFSNARQEVLDETEIARAESLLAKNIEDMARWVILPPETDMANVRRVSGEKIGTLRRLVLR